MSKIHTLVTERLILRPWKEEDIEPFARLNQDPLVMQYFPGLKTRAETEEMVKLFMQRIEEFGWGLWAAALRESDTFIGFIGLQHVYFTAPFTPAVEIGWRLAQAYWGKGYATEGAKACLKFAFETIHLDEIVSFTSVQNMRARAVMERIGMHHNHADDFDHPNLPKDHPLCRHVLYRKKRSE